MLTHLPGTELLASVLFIKSNIQLNLTRPITYTIGWLCTLIVSARAVHVCTIFFNWLSWRRKQVGNQHEYSLNRKWNETVTTFQTWNLLKMSFAYYAYIMNGWNIRLKLVYFQTWFHHKTMNRLLLNCLIMKFVYIIWRTDRNSFLTINYSC